MASQILKRLGENRLETAGLKASLDHTVIGAIGHENVGFRVRIRSGRVMVPEIRQTLRRAR